MADPVKPPADYPARKEFARIFDLTPALICVAAPDGRFLYLNAGWERVLDYSHGASAPSSRSPSGSRKSPKPCD